MGFTMNKTVICKLNQSCIGSILILSCGAQTLLQCAHAIEIRLGCDFKITNGGQRSTG